MSSERDVTCVDGVTIKGEGSTVEKRPFKQRILRCLDNRVQGKRARAKCKHKGTHSLHSEQVRALT